MPIIKAIVIEDSRIAREGLVEMLQAYPFIQVVGQAAHPSVAITIIQEHMPDVLFLDIHMPEQNGFDLLAMLDYSPKIIFTTAYSEYAIRSFDYHTIDYLLKPISEDRLSAAIQKLSVIQPDEFTLSKPVLDIGSKMLIKDSDVCHLVALDKIRYFQSCKNHVIVYFNDASAFVNKTLNSVEERLPQQHFFRANRQFIINLNAITDIQESVKNGYEITMSDKRMIEVSRRNAIYLKELLSF